MNTSIVAEICRMLGRLLMAGLLLSSILPVGVLAAPPLGSGEPVPKNALDIAVIDQVLATVKPGQKMVPFGDVGMKPEDLRVFRQKLVDEQARSGQGPSPTVDTPPGTAFKWPAGVVPYRFDPTQVSNGTITAAKMQQFRDGVAEWAAFANLHFNEFTGTTPPNFVTVQEMAGSEGGFSSSVGMAGGEQFVQFGPNSWNRGTVCHEVGHAIGLYHEQQRDDRDTYVVILTQNIIPGTEPNFAKLPGGSVAQGAYDFYSVMHYARNALSIDPDHLDTIEPQPPYSQFLDIMGQVFYRALSKLDRAGMAVVYGNPSPLPSAVVTNTNDSGSGSLRAALYYAFDKSTDIPPVPTTVVFHIPTSDPGFASNVFTIKPTYLMVAPGAGTTIDGSTQTAFTGNTNPSGPEVVLDGSQIAVQNLFAAGLDLREANCKVKNLVIGSFNTQGVLIEGTGATGNILSGCYIGTDATGTNAMPNTFPGVEIVGGANGNIIGGTTVAARNIISGNAHIGVSIHDSGTTTNVVEGNYIGLNATGTAALPNTYSGAEIFGGASNNTIGSSNNAGGRNIISGNSAQGIVIADAGSNSNKVPGNVIGLNPTGTVAIGNQFEGIAIFGSASSNITGGTANASPNIISGNVGSGISISGVGTKMNKVQHNFIGTNLSGTAAFPNNGGIGIFGGATTNTIGGTTASVRNVISGNNYQGIAISGTGTKSNTVAGNFIGTNNAGTAALPNTAAGISIFLGAQSNIIGGATAASRNVISGNLNQGITLSDSGTKQNQILSNYIGLNAAGTAAIPNSWSGVDIFTAAASNIIGDVGKGNVISGNGNYGVALSGTGTLMNSVKGNLIGLNPAATGGIGNAFSGVILFNGAKSNIIGNSLSGAGNMIAFNTFSGIDVFDSTTTGNDFNANSIFSNGTLGINLVGGSENGFGVTANDPADADNGPNKLQNYPVLTFANSAAVIQGSLNSVANKPYRIDFFSSPAADASGFGEGQTWIGVVNLTTDGTGNATFNQDFPGSLTPGSVVTATATGTGTGGSGTSEFSAAITVVP
jgi:Astacin (Peptidase family M12A)